jgi:sulfur carrier protein
MQITLNGQSKDIQDNMSAESLINTACKKPELVICELNGTILDRTAWAGTCLKPHDKLELITFVGGG